jgi:hypothetical protein
MAHPALKEAARVSRMARSKADDEPDEWRKSIKEFF